MKERKPEIRFKGYSDSWVVKPFGDMFDTISNNTLSRDKLNSENGSVLNIHYGDVLIKYGEVLDIEKEQIPYITDESDSEKFKSALLHDGDIVIADTAEDETVGKCTEIYNTGDNKVLSGLHTIPCRPREKYSTGFLGYCMNSKRYHDQLIPLMQGTKVTSISKAGLNETELVYPESVAEQEDIASFLFMLNKKIRLERSICEKLIIIKNAMIEKLFPPNGSETPEVRFSGFTKEWKQQMLSGIADKVTVRNEGTTYLETFTNSAELGIVSQTDYFDHGITKIENIDSYFVVENDAFVYNPRISIAAPVGPINRNKLGRTGVMSPLYTVFKVHDVDLDFLEWLFKSRIWHSYMYYNGDSGARADRFSIRDDIFFKMTIPLPAIEEQVLIGKFMTKIDKLVSLHQRKVEKLMNIQSACMEKMFA